MNGSSELVSWEEKPKLKYIINGGIYGVSKKVIGYIKNNIPRNQHIDMPTLWGIMKDNGMKLAVHIHRGKWHDVGRMEDYMALTEGRGDHLKALVTGAGGFIGSHLTEYLTQKGFQVKAFVRYNSKTTGAGSKNRHNKDKIEVYTATYATSTRSKTR
jgi:NDP-sugar pyrophosphorylase family protein